MSARPCLVLATPHAASRGGGLECYVANLMTALQERYDWRIVLVTTAAAGERGTRRTWQAGVVIYELPRLFTVSNTPFHPFWHRHIREIVDRERVNLINAHAPVPGMADLTARAAGQLPFVLTYHAGPMRKGDTIADLGIAAYERLLLGRLAARADTVICNSTFVRDAFAGHFSGKSVVIPPGVDTDRFLPAASWTGQRILFVANLSAGARLKGLDDLLRAVVLLLPGRPGVRVDVVGGGTALASYVTLARRLRLSDRVTFYGQLEGQALVAAYQRSTVLALPAHRDSVPTVLIEAGACGLPVVATRVGGVGELIDDGVEGFLIDPGDVGALAQRLDMVLGQPELGRSMGAAGRRRVEVSASWRVLADATQRVYTEALDHLRAGPAHVGD
jgi:glycosyltransferase involved in cell wall biosynthesis